MIEAHVRYHAPARYDDVIRVEPRVTELKGATLRFEYRITKGDELLAEGWTVHACISAATRRLTRFPDEIRRLLEGRP